MLRIQKKQTLKSLISEDFRKTQKSRYLEDETFLITHQELYFIAKNTFVVDVTFKVKIEYSLELWTHRTHELDITIERMIQD